MIHFNLFFALIVLSITVISGWDTAWNLIRIVLLYRLLKALYILTRAFYLFYLAQRFQWTTDLKKYKHLYVAITGCTDGIGKSYALHLAKKGMRKFILMGRNEKKLKDVAQMLRKNGVQEIKEIVIDLANGDYSTLDGPLKSYEIGILVNCAGLAPAHLGTLTESPVGLPTDIIKVNALATVKTCELVLPQMEERNLGIIVNVASIQGWNAVPLLGVYSASKACVSILSKAINLDYINPNSGIKCQCLAPIFVATKMIHYSDKAADGHIVIDADEYARQAVSVIGMHKLTTGCWQQEIQLALVSLLPYWVRAYVVYMIYYIQKKLMEAEKLKDI